MIIKKINIWYYILDFWTIIFLFVVLLDFLKNNILESVMQIFSVIYVGALVVYAGDKEFERWTTRHFSKRFGEIYIIIWTILLFFIVAFDFLMDKPYETPGAVISAYIAALTIFALTQKSKSVFRKKRKIK